MKTLFTLVSMLILGLSTSVFADCIKDGKPYKTGERAGAYTCMADGSWRR